jgi:predicted kinase
MTNQPKLLLTRGIPASGKDTFALEWVNEDPEWRARVNRDELRFNLFGKYVLDRHGEESVTTVQQAAVRALLDAKRSVIVSDTNLRAQTVREWLKLARSAGVEVELVDFNTPLDECLRRNKARGDAGGRFVPEDVIHSFASRYIRNGKLPDAPKLEEDAASQWRHYEPDFKDATKRDAYLFDIDGTLAQMSDRGPFEWHRVGEDTPFTDVLDVLSQLLERNEVVFMSGRDEACRAATRAWITEHTGIEDFDLFMRPAGDMRKDSIVKHELFWKHVEPSYRVRGVFDDRDQVVKMWREMGLRCYQVAPGAF